MPNVLKIVPKFMSSLGNDRNEIIVWYKVPSSKYIIKNDRQTTKKKFLKKQKSQLNDCK